MSILYKQENDKKGAESPSTYDVEKDLRQHNWHPYMNAMDAVVALKGQPPFSYILRPSEHGRGFAISFVQKNGHVAHDYFSLLNPKFGIWRNLAPHHVGSLDKVIQDMMRDFSE